MADKITNDITLLFKTKLDEKSKQEVGKNLKSLLENAAIGFDEAETKRNLEPIVRMMQKLFNKAEIAFDADKLLSMPSRQALQEMAKMEVDQLQLAFDKALAKSGGVKIDFGDIGLSEFAAPLKQIENELSDISRKIADTTKKSVYEIEQSLRSISKNKSFKKIASPESIESALLESSNDKKIQPSKAADQLEKARDLYETSVKEDNPWVVQYKYLLDFVSKYEKLTHQAKTKIEAERPEFKQLYDMLSPKAGAVKISLEHYVDMARGNELSEYKNQPWGRESTLKEIRDTLKSGISVKEDSGGNKNDSGDSTSPFKDNDEDSKKPNTKAPLADSADVSAAEQAKKLEEERLLLAEQRRIEQEKIAEMLKKEVLDNARHVSAKKIYRTVYSPLDEENLSREERKAQYGGAEIWTSSSEVANTYADGEDDPVMLKGSLSANNAYIIDANGATWKDFGKMKVLTPDGVDEKNKVKFSETMLRDEFPELFHRIDNKEFSYEEDIQAELYKAIKSLGYDALVTKNVIDAKDVDGYKEPSTIYAVFDDNILEVLGAYAVEEQDEYGTTSFEKKARRENIPEYYKMPEHTQAETVMHQPPVVSDTSEEVNNSLTKETTLLEKIQRLTAYIDDNYLSTGKHLSDFLNDVQGESNELDGELKEILTTLNLIDDKGNLTFDVKRNGEEGGGTTHNGALISDDFVLIERGDYESVKNSHLPDSTQNAAKDGVNVAEVLGYLPSKHTGGFFDVQGTAKGHNLFDGGVISQDVVNATEDQLEQLIQAFIKARDYGFDIENAGSNIVYDKEKGFSFYDLEEYSVDDAKFWNSKTEAEKKLIALENLFSLFSGINRDHGGAESDPNVENFTKRIKSVIESRGIISPDAVDEDGRNYEDIYDDVFSGDIDAESADIIARLQAEEDAHRQNAAAIKEEKQEQEEANQSFLDGVLAAARARVSLEDTEVDSSSEVAAEKAENDAINQQNDALKENIDLKERANVQNDGILVNDDAKLDTTKLSSGSTEVKASIDTEELRGLLNSITYNVKVVQDAEPTDSNKVSINADELRSVLDGITYNVKLTQGETDNDSNKVAIDESALEGVLNRVFSSVLKPVDNSVDMGKVLEAIQSIPTGGKSSKDVDINPHYVTDPSGKPVVAYRGIQGNYGGLVSNRYHGGTFSTDDIELAQQYAGEMGKIEKILLSMKNPLEIDGHGAEWNNINYIGHGADEVSRELIYLKDEIRELAKYIDNYVDGDAVAHPVTGEPMDDIDAVKKLLTDARWRQMEISNDPTNPYGIALDTNKFVELAKTNGYDGVIFKNVYDGLDKASNLMVTFETEQIHYIETISAEVNSALQELQMRAGEFDKYINMTDDDVAGMVKQLEIMRDHFLSDWSLGKENPEDIYSRVKGEFIDPYPAFKSLFDAYFDMGDLPDDYIRVPDFLSPAGFNGNDLFVDLSNFLTHIRETAQKTQVGSDIAATSAEEPWALESTLQSVKSVLDQIQTNTAKPESVEAAPASTDVGNVLATENTLAAIKAAVEAINSKVVKGTKATTSGGGGKKTNVGKKNAESYAGSQYFPEKIKTQTMQLAKFRAQLMTTGKLTDDVDAQIYELLEALKQVKNGPDLSRWNQQFLQLKTSVGITDIFENAEDKDVASSYKQIIEFQKMRNKLELEYERAQDGSALKQFYAEQLAQIDLVIAKQEELIENEEYEAKIAKMQAEQEIKLGAARAKAEDKDAKTAAADAKRFAQREAMLGKAGSAVGRAETTWMNAAGIDGLPAGFEADLNEYYQKLDALRKKHQELKNSKKIREEDKNALIAQTMEVNKLTEGIGELVAEYQKLSGDNATVIGANVLGSDADLNAYEQQLKQTVMTATNGKAQIKNFDAVTKTLTYTVKTGKNEFTEYTAAVRRLDGQLVSVQGTTKRTETFFEATARKMKELTSYFSGMAVFNFAKQQLMRGIQYVREIDLALTELKKVTDETEESYDKFLETAAKTADKVGSTIQKVVSSTADWARLNI